jgi:hypothetical protein
LLAALWVVIVVWGCPLWWGNVECATGVHTGFNLRLNCCRIMIKVFLCVWV